MNRTEIVANDEALADAANRIDQAQLARARALDALHSYVDDHGQTKYIGRRSYTAFKLSTEETLEAARNDVGQPYYQDQRVAYLKKYAEAEIAEAQAEADYTQYNDVWADNGRWNRFFLVQGGHIHSSTSCHSLRITTRIGWLPKLSGLTEADAVAEYGSILCTHCYPGAPVEWTNGYDEAAKAKKAAACPGSGTYDWEKAAKAAGEKPNYGRRYQKCPHCNSMQSITTTGKFRSHKPAKA